MRDQTKVIIGLGSIWGLFAFGAILWSSFTLGANDTAPEVIALILYGLTVLPSCILAIWFQKGPGWGLIILSFISIFGVLYQVVHQGVHFSVRIAFPIFFASVPGIIGVLLLLSRSGEVPRHTPNAERENGEA